MASQDKKAAKLWNEDSAYIFTCYMEDEIKNLLEESDFESKFVNSWVEQIVDIAQQKLKAMKKPKLNQINYIYTLLFFLFIHLYLFYFLTHIRNAHNRKNINIIYIYNK